MGVIPTFGNKVTWEKDLIKTFQAFCNDVNQYVFSNNQNNKSTNGSALQCKETADVIYMDPPYISEKGHHVNYHSRYHFLEALVNYDSFTQFISLDKQNKEIMINKSNEFESKQTIHQDIHKLIAKHRDKTIVFSYRNHGIPSPDELKEIFLTYKKSCKEFILDQHYYALNRSNHQLHELVYILE